MGLSGALRAWGFGDVPAVRTGLLALVLGALAMMLTLFMMSPAIDGMVGLAEHSIERPVATRAPVARHAAPPPLTAFQRAAARRSAVRAAVLQVGVRETGGSNRGPRITAYRRAVTGHGEKAWKAEPWCADFVSWAWRRAGVPIGFGGRGSDYVPELVAWASFNSRWHRARDGYRPRPGDLVVYGRAEHIGMVGAVRAGRIVTIEGNWSDRVSRRIVKPWDPGVMGFISPV